MIIYLSLFVFAGIVLFVYNRTYKPCFSSKASSDVSSEFGFFYTSALVAAGVLVMKLFVYDFVTIPSGSMLPNYSIDQKLIVDKKSFGVRNPITYDSLREGRMPATGEVVISRFPKNPDILYLKRVVALPGDTIAIDETGILLNGQRYPLNFKESKEFTLAKEPISFDVYTIRIEDVSWDVIVDPAKGFPVQSPIEVSQDMVYLLGDNLSYSSDSRDFGPIAYQLLLGSIF